MPTPSFGTTGLIIGPYQSFVVSSTLNGVLGSSGGLVGSSSSLPQLVSGSSSGGSSTASGTQGGWLHTVIVGQGGTSSGTLTLWKDGSSTAPLAVLSCSTPQTYTFDVGYGSFLSGLLVASTTPAAVTATFQTINN